MLPGDDGRRCWSGSGGIVRERGTQSRRVRPGPVEPFRRPGPPPPRSGGNFWQVLAIVALVAATAGWTTVGVLVLRPGPSAEAEVPIESFDPEPTDDPDVPPVADTHDALALESLLPATLSGTALEVQSWDGEGLLIDDPWSMSMSAFLTAHCKVPADLRVAQSYDPNQALDAGIGVYEVDGVEATALRDALIAAWKGDYPEMTVSQVMVGDKDVTKGEFGEDTITSYLYIRGDVVYDIESSDEAIATAALAALPDPDTSAAPAASGSPAAVASCVPASGSPAPEASPSES
jgi:hypothetical protein